MPIMFNTNQPMAQSQLDNLYMGDPNVSPDQVDSNLFLGSSQAQNWVHSQAQNLGVGSDPASYYNQILLARKMAQTPSGLQSNLAQMTGNFSPLSLPGQLARRNAMVDQASQQQTQQQQQLASLQTQNNDRAYPLPAAGTSPTLSPVAQTAMAQQGITNPLQFLMQQRLGPNAGAVDTAKLSGATGAINPDDLFNEPTFQSALNRDPNKAGSVFQALTGQDFGKYATNYAASKNQERTAGVAFLRKSLEDGTAVANQDGSIGWRQQVQNPTTGQMVPGPTVAPGNAFQKSVEKYMPYMDSDLARFQRLAQKGGASAAPVASVQTTADNGAPGSMQSALFGGGGSVGSTLLNTAGGVVNDVHNLASSGLAGISAASQFMGGPNLGGSVRPIGTDAVSQGFAPVIGGAVRHAAPMLRNNVQFQNLLKNNPEAARRMIMALQLGNQQAPAEDPNLTYQGQ